MGDLANLMKLVRMQEEGSHPCRTCYYRNSETCTHPRCNGWENLCDNCGYWKQRV